MNVRGTTWTLCSSAALLLGLSTTALGQLYPAANGEASSRRSRQDDSYLVRADDHGGHGDADSSFAFETAPGGHDGHGHHEHGHHGDGHHGHGEECFDCILPYHARHETLAGAPFFQMLVTDHAFFERYVRAEFVSLNNVKSAHADEAEFEFRLFQPLNNRLAVVLDAPIILYDPDNGSSTEGFGDLEIGLRFLAFNGPYSIISFGLNTKTPTGDHDRHLGSGHTVLEPIMLSWHDLGCGLVLQTEFGFEIPVDVDDPENEFIYNIALSRTLFGTSNWCRLRYLTPLVELNGKTLVNGHDSGESTVNITPGFHWDAGGHNHAGFGFSFPVSGHEEFDSKFIVTWIHHY